MQKSFTERELQILIVAMEHATFHFQVGMALKYLRGWGEKPDFDSMETCFVQWGWL